MAFLVSNAFLFVNNIPTDGLCLLTIPFASRSATDSYHAAYFGTQGWRCIEDGQYEEGKKWCLKGLDIYPEHMALLFYLGLAQLALEEFSQARQQFRKAYESKTVEESLRALLLTSMALADLVIGGDDLLEEAEQYSKEAMLLAAKYPSVESIRGWVLIERGCLDEGMALVRKLLKASPEPQPQALNACYLAIGEARKGNRDKALRWRDMARRLNGSCILLKKVDGEISAKTHQTGWICPE